MSESTLSQNIDPVDASAPQDGTFLWKTFASARSENEYYQYWLALQSQLVRGVVQSLLVINQGGQFAPVASWPMGTTDFSKLGDVVERVIDEKCGLLAELDHESHYGVAYPFFIDGTLTGVIALEVAVTSESQLQQSMEALQWGTGWLELLVRRGQVDENQALLHRLKTSVDLLAITLNKESFSAAATAFTTELAMATNCERVSLGFVKGAKIVLQSVSYSADVGQKMNLTKAIESVMDEALFQRREIVFPLTNDEILINRAHDALSRQQSMASIATFPLFRDGHYYGCLSCERAADLPFTERDIEFFRAVASLAGPAIEAKYVNDRPLLVKVKSAAEKQMERMFGGGFYLRKIIVSLVAIVFVLLSFVKGDYRLSTDIVLEGSVRRSVVVPFDGFIEQALVRAGDLVAAGQLLCSLDDRDLRLINLAKQSEYRQLQRQHEDATAKHDRAQSKIIQAQLEQAQAEIDLVQEKLVRTGLPSPFAGLVVSGDLSQRLGSAVQQGDVLFEITPLDGYRVILKVDERRINDVKVGQHGALVLASLPQQKFQFTVTKTTPIAQAEEGRNYFRVEASLDTIDDSLRPGMEGVGKIDIDRRRVFSIWTRDMMEWLRLSLWSWFA